MRGCEDASRSHDVERMRSSSCGDLDSGVACLGRNAYDPFDQEILILRSTDVAEQGDVVAIEGDVGLWFISLGPGSEGNDIKHLPLCRHRCTGWLN